MFSVGGYDISLDQVLIVPTVILIGYVLLKVLVGWLVGLLKARGVNADVVHVFRRGLFVLGLVILTITALDLLSVPLTAFAFVSGAVAIGVGFGAQNIINNFISGWILMWERPIRIGDFIELEDTNGTVEEINTRSTRIRRTDGVHMLVPNARLLEETVINWTLIDSLLRCVVRVGVAYGSDVGEVARLLEHVAEDHPDVLREPTAQVIFEDFGDNALIFDVYFWVNSGGDRSARVVRSDVRFAINKVFAESEIVVAFPQRDVHLDGTLQLEMSGS